jgi:predicted transcriptional regulator
MDPGASVIARLADGTPYFGRLGEIAYDAAEDRVQCHLCGGWYRWIGVTHLMRTHAWSLDEYRDAFRLPRLAPTCAPV